MFFFILTGLFVSPVGFIMLLIRISSKIEDGSDNMMLWSNENLFKLGKLNSGERAITPARGKLGFS